MARRVKKGKARSRAAAPIKKKGKAVPSTPPAGKRRTKATPARSRIPAKKRAVRVIPSTVSRWVRRLDPDARAKRLQALYLSLKEVRAFYAGFEARDGFRLNDLKRLSPTQAASITRRASYVRELQSRPAVPIRPRSKKSKQLLNLHTGQGKLKGQKKYLYHTDAPERTRVRVRGKKVETLRKFIGKDDKPHTSVYRNYYFPFSRRFRTWDELMEVAEELIKRLPAGRYRVVSSLHSDVGVPTDKKMLLQTMQNWFDTYGVAKPGMAESIIGFRWIGLDFKQTDKKLRTTDLIRQAFKKREEKRRRKERELARKRLGKR